MKKKFAAKEGFTLVELIVVIAILGILAGVAIPAYSAYLKKANDAAVVTELDAIKTAVQSANASAGDTIEKIVVTDTGAKKIKIVVTPKTGKTLATSFAADFKIYYKDTTIAQDSGATTYSTGDVSVGTDFGDTSYASGATWTPADGWKAN